MIALTGLAAFMGMICVVQFRWPALLPVSTRRAANT
jgi:hypothetical protein